MRRLQQLLFAVALSSVASGCLVSGTMRSQAYVSTPDLVYVSPGVEVVADYDEPVFYSDNYYWRYNGGVWYRSGYYNTGWVRWTSVPVAIGRIDRPQVYVRYHGEGQRRRIEQRQQVRDHRQDVRQDRREQRKDNRKERRDERKDERKDHKKDRPDVRDHRH